MGVTGVRCRRLHPDLKSSDEECCGASNSASPGAPALLLRPEIIHFADVSGLSIETPSAAARAASIPFRAAGPKFLDDEVRTRSPASSA